MKKRVAIRQPFFDKNNPAIGGIVFADYLTTFIFLTMRCP